VRCAPADPAGTERTAVSRDEMTLVVADVTFCP